MKDGQKILFHGEGDQEPELEPGDVIIVLDQKDHSVFQRRGHDLIMKMKIQLSEALCGFKKTIKTLDDRVLVITSRSGRYHPPCLRVDLTVCAQRSVFTITAWYSKYFKIMKSSYSFKDIFLIMYTCICPCVGMCASVNVPVEARGSSWS